MAASFHQLLLLLRLFIYRLIAILHSGPLPILTTHTSLAQSLRGQLVQLLLAPFVEQDAPLILLKDGHT